MVLQPRQSPEQNRLTQDIGHGHSFAERAGLGSQKLELGESACQSDASSYIPQLPIPRHRTPLNVLSENDDGRR